MDIRKRNGQPEAYECGKIKSAILCAFASVNQEPGRERMDRIMSLVEEKVEGAVKGGASDGAPGECVKLAVETVRPEE